MYCAMAIVQDETSDFEEILVYAEFDDSVNIDKYRTLHVLGINEKNPIIQMDDNFFMGKFKNPLGTYMFFEEDPSTTTSDPLFDAIPEKNLKYKFKTRKCLNIEHAYVTSKEKSENHMELVVQQSEEDTESVNFKTLQEAIEKFQNEWHPKFNPDITTLKTIINNDENNQDMGACSEIEQLK